MSSAPLRNYVCRKRGRIGSDAAYVCGRGSASDLLFEIGHNNVQGAACQSIRFRLVEARSSQLKISRCAPEIGEDEKTQENDETKDDDQRHAI